MGRIYSCTHCGREVDASGSASSSSPSQPLRCPACGRDFLPAEEARPRSHHDPTVSRTMLLPLPQLGGGPPGELIGRLEPETLRWLGVTEALADYLGGGMERLGRETVLDSLHDDDRALAADEFRRAAEEGERHDFVLRVRDRDGRWRYCRILAQARYDPGGTLHHIRCNLKDVTDRLRAEQELRRRTEQLTEANEQLRRINRQLRETQAQLVQSEKLASLGTLAAGMAHEINNPLAFATSNVAVIGRDAAALLGIVAAYREGRESLAAADPALAGRIAHLEEEADLPYLLGSLPELVASTRRGLERVARIVHDLRDFAQLDRSPVAELDLSRSLAQALGMLSDRLERGRIAVDRRFAEVPTVLCAAANVNHALLNLLSNAIQAIEATGRGSGLLRVETRPTADGVVVEVGDDGIGIAPEVLPRIFDPFFTTKPVGGGTGLGLSLSHAVIAEHGGRIEVESRPGAGSVFRVHLPANPVAGAGASLRDRPAVPPVPGT